MKTTTATQSMLTWSLCNMLVKKILCGWSSSEYWVRWQPQHSSCAAKWPDTGLVPGQYKAAETTPSQLA